MIEFVSKLAGMLACGVCLKSEIKLGDSQVLQLVNSVTFGTTVINFNTFTSCVEHTLI